MKKSVFITFLFVVITSLGFSYPDPYTTISLPITLTGTDSIQQLTVPTQMIAGSRSAELSDIVITNAQGQSVPIAWVPSEASQQQHTYTLKTHTLKQSNLSSNDYRQILLKHDSISITTNQSNSSKNNVVGAILDTRMLPAGEYASGLILDIMSPLGQIVPLTIERSNDLKEWQTLVETAVVRLPETQSSTIFDIPMTDIHGQYVRILWSEPTIHLASASIITQTTQQPSTQEFDLNLSVSEAGVWSAYLPAALLNQSSKLTLQTQTNNINVPVNILFSDKPQLTDDNTLKPSGQTVLFNLTKNGQTVKNNGLNIRVPKDKHVLVLTPSKGQTIPSDLKASVELSTRKIAFVTSGTAPFTMRYKNDTSQTTRPIASLLPNYQIGDADKLPTATISVDSVYSAFTAHPELTDPTQFVDSSTSHKSRWLWVVLIGGVLLLAGMVIIITRQLNKTND